MEKITVKYEQLSDALKLQKEIPPNSSYAHAHLFHAFY